MAWLRLLADNYSPKFLVMLLLGEHLLKGFVGGGGGGGMLVSEKVMYRGRASLQTQQAYFSVTGLAWALKPLFSIITDGSAMFGYRRAPWIVITAALSTGAILMLLMLPLPPIALCIAFLIIKVNISCTDIILEGQWTEKLAAAPEYAPDLMSFVYMGMSLCSIFGVLVAGPGLDKFGENILWVCIPIPAMCALGALCGLTTEKRAEEPCGLQTECIYKYRHFFLCGVMAAVCVLGTAALNLLPVLGQELQFVLSMLLATLMCVSYMWLLPASIWKPCLYLFISNVLSLDYSSVTYSFYLDDAQGMQRQKCPDFCPHFQAWFFVTVIQIIDAGFALLGSWLFKRTMSGWTYRRVMGVSQVLVMVASASDAIQFSRVNKLLGIPDEVFLMGKSATISTCFMMNFMPMMILISQVCPEGVETLTFALMAGITNFGSAVSGLVSAHLMQYMGLENTDAMESWNFDNAWILALMGSFLPAISLCLLPFAIPDKRMTDPIRETAESEQTELLKGKAMDSA